MKRKRKLFKKSCTFAKLNFEFNMIIQSITLNIQINLGLKY
jgi:hypothetical protein